MNLLIPFIDFDLYAWIGLAVPFVPYQIYRKKTPFRASITRDRRSVVVSVVRRCGADWPTQADEVSKRVSGRDLRNSIAVDVANIRSDDIDADERLIAAIVEAKHYVTDWKRGTDTDRLYKIGKKALKR